MKKLLSVAAATGLASVGALATASPAMADDRICRGSIGAVRVSDNIKVPAGATCVLTGTRVEGNVIVNRGATLRATSVRVDGSIQSEGHAWVAVLRSTVDGNIQLKQGRGLNVAGNTVDGDIQVFSNKSGAKTIRNNRVDGNLQCKSNTPAPVGSGNIVKGNKEDQCRRL